MASTTKVFGSPSTGLAGRRFDNVFFSAMALVILATVFLGFAHSYYLAGVFRAPLPSPIVHIHGAAMSCWMLLFITQICLVSAGRVDIHRRLGIAGFLLACLMVLLGVSVATDQLVRNSADPTTGVKFQFANFLYIVAITGILVFAILIFFAFRMRSNPAAHKRLILIATIELTSAAIARLPFAFLRNGPPLFIIGTQLAIQFAYLLPIVGYDLWSTRKIQRATLWGSAFLISLEVIKIPIGFTGAWNAFSTWVLSIARCFIAFGLCLPTGVELPIIGRYVAMVGWQPSPKAGMATCLMCHIIGRLVRACRPRLSVPRAELDDSPTKPVVEILQADLEHSVQATPLQNRFPGTFVKVHHDANSEAVEMPSNTFAFIPCGQSACDQQFLSHNIFGHGHDHWQKSWTDYVLHHLFVRKKSFDASIRLRGPFKFVQDDFAAVFHDRGIQCARRWIVNVVHASQSE